MGAEYMGSMGDSSFDHDVTRVVAGDAESLRDIAPPAAVALPPQSIQQPMPNGLAP